MPPIVVVDRGVQGGTSDPGAILLPGLPAEGAVPATVGDAAEFLHVDVHEIAGISRS
ncbi:hypothetical protein [Cryobacterium sp. Sr47]